MYNKKRLKEAKQRIIAEGLTYGQFAKKNDISIHAVRDLLYGRVRGDIGEAHKAAIALGLKKNPNK